MNLAIFIWILGLIITAGFSIPTNGQSSPTTCYSWNRYASMSQYVWSTYSFVVVFNFIPTVAMVTAYSAICRSLFNRGVRQGGGVRRWCTIAICGRRIADVDNVTRKVSKQDARNESRQMNLLRTLATCVLVYILCHMMRCILNIYILYEQRETLQKLYVYALLLMQVNSAVNPLIYLLQYKDFRKETNILLNRLYFFSGKKIVTNISRWIRRESNNVSDITV